MGLALLRVNGIQVRDHVHGTNLLRGAFDTVELTLAPPNTDGLADWQASAPVGVRAAMRTSSADGVLRLCDLRVMHASTALEEEQ